MSKRGSKWRRHHKTCAWFSWLGLKDKWNCILPFWVNIHFRKYASSSKSFKVACNHMAYNVICLTNRSSCSPPLTKQWTILNNFLIFKLFADGQSMRVPERELPQGSRLYKLAPKHCWMPSILHPWWPPVPLDNIRKSTTVLLVSSSSLSSNWFDSRLHCVFDFWIN